MSWLLSAALCFAAFCLRAPGSSLAVAVSQVYSSGPDSVGEYRAGALFHVLLNKSIFICVVMHMLEDKARAIKSIRVIPALLELSSEQESVVRSLQGVHRVLCGQMPILWRALSDHREGCSLGSNSKSPLQRRRVSMSALPSHLQAHPGLTLFIQKEIQTLAVLQVLCPTNLAPVLLYFLI